MCPYANRPGAGTPDRLNDFAFGGGSVDTDSSRLLEQIQSYLATASMVHLGELLTEVDCIEAGHFYCPRCQTTPGEQISHMAAAHPTGPLFWACSRCRSTGTRSALVDRVQSIPTAMARLEDLLADEVTI